MSLTSDRTDWNQAVHGWTSLKELDFRDLECPLLLVCRALSVIVKIINKNEQETLLSNTFFQVLETLSKYNVLYYFFSSGNSPQIHSKIGDISQKIMSDQDLQALKMNPCFPIPQYISVSTSNKKTVEYWQLESTTIFRDFFVSPERMKKGKISSTFEFASKQHLTAYLIKSV